MCWLTGRLEGHFVVRWCKCVATDWSTQMQGEWGTHVNSEATVCAASWAWKQWRARPVCHLSKVPRLWDLQRWSFLTCLLLSAITQVNLHWLLAYSFNHFPLTWRLKGPMSPIMLVLPSSSTNRYIPKSPTSSPVPLTILAEVPRLVDIIIIVITKLSVKAVTSRTCNNFLQLLLLRLVIRLTFFLCGVCCNSLVKGSGQILVGFSSRRSKTTLGLEHRVWIVVHPTVTPWWTSQIIKILLNFSQGNAAASTAIFLYQPQTGEKLSSAILISFPWHNLFLPI